MNKKTLLILGVLGLSPVLLSSCAALGVAIGAKAGISASKEGGIAGALSDVRIQAEINDLWFKYSTEAFGQIDMTITNGRVLLTGIVQNPDHRVEAVRLAWKPKGVGQVINEIKIAESEGVKGFARDSWITTRLRASILFDKEVQSLNYTIDTVQGTIYLMGVASSQEELDKVTELARTIKDVQSVVSYVKMPSLTDGNQPQSTATEGEAQ